MPRHDRRVRVEDAAEEIASMMEASLSQFPIVERDARLARILRTLPKAGDERYGKAAKPAQTRVTPRAPAVVQRRNERSLIAGA